MHFGAIPRENREREAFEGEKLGVLIVAQGREKEGRVLGHGQGFGGMECARGKRSSRGRPQPVRVLGGS